MQAIPRGLYETLLIATTCSARVEDSKMPSPLPCGYSDVEANVHNISTIHPSLQPVDRVIEIEDNDATS